MVRSRGAAAGAGDADALEGLDAFALAFLDLDHDAQRVAGLEVGDRALGDQAGFFFGFDRLKDVHSILLGLLRPLAVIWRARVPHF